ncbi:hypothetical protein GYMLUDRAFT_43205 [Collybiopsis luxurians FD-317 M1]|uniref:DUF1766-domain-containing protein n=1 Tax=Collybiopsis luxurians FD-317 M1 TaxID=944289 RepID=A0A0D0BZ27_9AGAR|nr:hypothetical protein GYMLUDRAFT_43205 [Collybiopsis luxurians FD-317 M1]
MGTGYKLKGKAINLFAKLKPNNDDESGYSGPDISSRLSFSSSGSRSSSPTKVASSSPTKISASGAPPKGPRAPGRAHSDDRTPAQLADSLDSLNLSGNSSRRADPSAGSTNAHERYRSEENNNVYAPRHQHTNSAPGPFIGGFTSSTSTYPPPPPGYYTSATLPAANAGLGPGPLPRPPPMQFPTAALDSSLPIQYASHPQPSQQQLLTPYGGAGTPPSRPYSAPGPPGFPHPNTSPYPGPSPFTTPGSSPVHTPFGTGSSAYAVPQQPPYPGQHPPPPATSTPNLFMPPNPYPLPNPKAGRPLPQPSPTATGTGGFAFGALPQPQLPSSPTRPILNTQFNSPSAGPIKQTKQRRPRATSTPPTPVSDGGVTGVSGQIQCSGVTKAGKRCTRMVKGGPALVRVWGTGVAAAPDSSINTSAAGGVERFCHQHAKELLSPSGFYARKQNGQGQGRQEWINFADYIPPYLHPDTQVALRVEMEKPRSQSDVEGFIYTFEIRNPKDPSPPTISLKVGRAVNVVKRLSQWGKQCGSKEQVLRGWYPGEVDHDFDDEDNAVGQSMMKGRVKAGGRGVWCHRLERLIHLELADLAVNSPYLEPGWEAFTKGNENGKRYADTHPQYASGSGSSSGVAKGVRRNAAASASGSVISISSDSDSDYESSSGSPASRTPVKGRAIKSKSPAKSPGKSSTPAKSKKDRFLANGLGNGGGGAPCKDCGQIHKEIFEFARVPKGPKGQRGGRNAKKHVDYHGMEWEGIVKKVIEEWGEFVANYV